jgi:hypothetical protein
MDGDAGKLKGVSKKQRKQAEVLEERLEPRFEKLEEQLGKLTGLTAREDEEVDDGDLPALYQVMRVLQKANLENDPEALRLLRTARGKGPQAEIKLVGDLAELALRRLEKRGARASAVIQPSGGGTPRPDLRSEYEKRVGALRPGDVAGLMEVKREFRGRGLEVY